MEQEQGRAAVAGVRLREDPPPAPPRETERRQPGRGLPAPQPAAREEQVQPGAQEEYEHDLGLGGDEHLYDGLDDGLYDDGLYDDGQGEDGNGQRNEEEHGEEQEEGLEPWTAAASRPDAGASTAAGRARGSRTKQERHGADQAHGGGGVMEHDGNSGTQAGPNCGKRSTSLNATRRGEAAQ